MTSTLLKAFAATAILASAQHTFAYTTWTCLGSDVKWESNSIELRLGQISFANANWRDSLVNAMQNFNKNPSNFRYRYSLNDNNLNINNGQNEIWFSSDMDVIGVGHYKTFIQIDCIDYWYFGKDVEITEVDMVWNSTNRQLHWSMNKTFLWPYGGNYRPFQNTAMRGFATGAGLDNSSGSYNLMGDENRHINANGSIARAYLGEDAANGLVYLYRLTTAPAEDLSISHFKKIGVAQGGGGWADAVSVHGRTVLRTSTGGSLSSQLRSGEVTYWVEPGQTVRLELTYENNGRSTHTEDVNFYVSSNDLVTTGDRYIGSTTMTLARNTVFTTYHTVTLPSNLVRGREYWLGAVIDANGTLGEMTNINNASYVPIYIRP